MSFVLDASAALAWVFERPDPGEAAGAAATLGRLRTERALVPELWHLEVTNALAVAHRRGAISMAKSLDFLARLSTLPIDTDPDSLAPRRDAIFALACDREISSYDAAYLDLAIRIRRPLATFDQRLARAALGAGLQVI